MQISEKPVKSVYATREFYSITDWDFNIKKEAGLIKARIVWTKQNMEWLRFVVTLAAIYWLTFSSPPLKRLQGGKQEEICWSLMW